MKQQSKSNMIPLVWLRTQEWQALEKTPVSQLNLLLRLYLEI